MLLVSSGTQPRHAVEPDAGAQDRVAGGVWIDLCEASDAERALVERATGLRVPAREELSEIENSSRLSAHAGVLTLSMPTVTRARGHSTISPLGFVLSRERLLTVRYNEMPVFDSFAEEFPEGDRPRTAVAAFVGLLEAIGDHLADLLEHVAGELETISRRVFTPRGSDRKGRAREDALLQETLQSIGRAADLVSHIRDSLLGVGRIAGYVYEAASDWTPAELRSRLTTLRQDIASLNDYDAQMTNKAQFLLDATLGLINIQQNNGIRVLTVVSVVGVPPTLVASIYGMNFKDMPELNWSFGYYYGLTVILLSAVLPLLWFRRRGWL